MKSLLKPVQSLILLQNFINCRKTSYANFVHQFKTQKPTYYPDRQRETKRMQEQLDSKMVAETNEKEDMPRDHYYYLLGVPTDATTSQIKAAYYALAKRYHPDASKGAQPAVISKRFQDILNAYRCLVDEAKRQEYDNASKNGNGKTPKNEQTNTANIPPQIVKSPPPSLHSSTKQSVSKPISNTMRDNILAAANKDDLLKMANVDPKLELTFLEAVHGLKKVVDLKFLKKCPSCNGKSQRTSGRANPELCRNCRGTGQVTKKTATYMSLIACELCNGKRYINRNQCDMCDNRGFVLDTTKITLQIPAGIKSGDIVSAENPTNKQRLNYRIQVKESDYYVRVGNNVFTDLYITISEAVLGGTFKVRGIYETLSLKVEAGTESHSQFKLAGKGIRGRDSTGDHIVTIKVQIPRQLTVKQRQLILALAKTEDSTYQRNG
uniref:J domain-containing protein n=1 Tax=Glossina brevipalpis TaxID=37001 RepID=A0A1A9WZP8_9MUSC